MLDYRDLLSRPSIEMNTLWEQIIKMVRLKNRNMCSDKKSYFIVVIIGM